MSSNVNNDGRFVSGFYYDTQKKNKLLSATLHPNMVTSDGGKTWDPVPENEAEDNDENVSLDGKTYKYRKKPIAKAIVKDDFVVAVANNWTDFSMGDQITQMWNSLKPFAPYAHFAADKLKEIQQANNELESEGDPAVDSLVYQLIDKAVDFITPYVDKAGGYLDRALVIQGTRFSYYAGTGTSFGNLSMKYHVFADWINGEFKSVNDQLEELYPYAMGKYIAWDEKDKKNSFNEFVGWQQPPGGYQTNVKSLDTVQQGTLKLKFGGYYSISNIVIKDAQFTFSKQMVKDPTNPNVISPLGCEVQLNLQPATKFSDISLKKFITGSFMKKDIEEIRSTLSSKLNAIKEQNNIMLGGNGDTLASGLGNVVGVTDNFLSNNQLNNITNIDKSPIKI